MPKILRLALISLAFALALIVGYIAFIWMRCESRGDLLGRVQGSSGLAYQCVSPIR